MLDPFPGVELLDRDQVRKLLGMERTSFERWLKGPSAKLFPAAVPIDYTPQKKRPVLRWKKTQVLAFLDLLGPDSIRPPE